MIRSVTSAIALALLLVSCSCGPRPYVLTPQERVTTTAYRVTVDCNGDGQWDVRGSASAIGPRTLVTARHVAVTCGGTTLPDGGVLWNTPKKITIMDPWETDRMVELDAVLLSSDVATLKLAKAEPSFRRWARVRSTMPNTGDPLYIYGGDADLQMIWKVGYMSGFDKNDLIISIHVVPGNSGGGVYDAEGRLVAVLHSGWWAEGIEHYMYATRPHVFKSLLGDSIPDESLK